MATFGTTDITGSINGGLAGYMIATKYTLTEAGFVNKISVYSNASGNCKAAIYTDVAGNPTARLSVNNTSTPVNGGQFNDIEIPDIYLLAGTYWLAVLDDAIDMRRAVASTSNKAAYNNITFATGCPDPFPAISFQDYDYCMYGTYTNHKGAPGNIGRHFSVGNGMSRSGRAN